jgi:hypothetical protein
MKRRRAKQETESRGWRPWRRNRDDRRRENPTHHPDVEPPHDQPWVPRSSFTDGVRRSPRS